MVGAEGPTAADVDAVTIRLDGGAQHRYEVGTLDLSNGGLPAPHLREHLVSGEPIRFTVHNDVLVHYTDASSP